MKLQAQFAALAAVLAIAGGAEAQQREQIRIVGSSTVFPFSTAVAESFGAKTGLSTPVVESTGSGGGLRLFCAGVGTEHPDIVNSSRRMHGSEYERCQDNGVREITEVRIGFDGIVIGAADRAAADVDISLEQVWLALAAEVPADDSCSSFIANPNERWSDIDPSLPRQRIEVFGPPPTSGTRDAFVELAMQDGAREIACMDTLRDNDRNRFEQIASRIREDGRWIDAGENDNAIVQTLVNTPTAFGVFGYSFLDQNSDRISAVSIDGVAPEFEAIADGSYPVSRSLFFYVKNQHAAIIPGLAQYIDEFTSEDAWGEFGYLTDRGLIPLPDAERDATREAAVNLSAMTQSPE
ncbi:phosphate ABC transporter substrate-binding protein [Maricaulis sp. W15]|uniref:Phosphate ABC transporter substrate-binding protein (PhoT family) n=1 Tax=Maricaulis maris TaxID=74318 RepID=A0A495D5S7_9PROT|nr:MULTISPECIES: substrate-binding domain-containing protein [Maricaulis]OLF71109.1 phosphate ABC transporter substrate-binding protein [Maricaulis sp. W15]RKQ96182.1 phosphate ABC transporter substrate-binding protein (PhoT family) [Maricaulis maris]